MIDSLTSIVNKIKLKNVITEWGNYYENTNYIFDSINQKHKLVYDFIKITGAKTAWDIGANDGTFSKLCLDFIDNVIISVKDKELQTFDKYCNEK